MPYDPLPENSLKSDRWSNSIKLLPQEKLLHVWLVWTILSGLAGITSAYIIARILSSRRLRQIEFCRLIIGLAIPDAIFGLSCCATCLLHYLHGEWFGGSPHCDIQSVYVVFGFAGSTWMYVLVALRLDRMVSCLEYGFAYEPLTDRQLIKHIGGAYALAAAFAGLQFTGVPMKANASHGMACLPLEYDIPSTIFHWAVFVFGAGAAPILIVTYYFGKAFWRLRVRRPKSIMNLSGLDAILGLLDNFMRLFFLLVCFWTPTFVFIWVSTEYPMFAFIGGTLSHSQGLISGFMYLLLISGMQIRCRCLFLGVWKERQISREQPQAVDNGDSFSFENGGVSFSFENEVVGIRMGDLQELAESNREWLEEYQWNDFGKAMAKKSMYDVAPEIVIPATTLEEYVVTIAESDLPKLRSRQDGGIFASETDLTTMSAGIAAALQCPIRGDSHVLLGGCSLPAGLTVHGRLVPNGPVRSQYWAKGFTRQDLWIPYQSEISRGTAYPSESSSDIHRGHVVGSPSVLADSEDLSGMGEQEDKIRNASDIKAGDTIVLRRGVSYVEMLRLVGVMQAIHFFVSHWWGGEFLSFVKALQRYALDYRKYLKVSAADVSYWICTFNNSQHRVELGDTLQASPFYAALKYIGASGGVVLLMAEPWNNPEMLKRAWCIFEILTCQRMGISIEMVFSPKELNDFNSQHYSPKSTRRSITADDALSSIDIATATTSVPSDRELIFEEVMEQGGPEVINSLIQGTMRNAIAAAAVKHSIQGPCSESLAVSSRNLSQSRRTFSRSFSRSSVSSYGSSSMSMNAATSVRTEKSSEFCERLSEQVLVDL